MNKLRRISDSWRTSSPPVFEDPAEDSSSTSSGRSSGRRHGTHHHHHSHHHSRYSRNKKDYTVLPLGGHRPIAGMAPATTAVTKSHAAPSNRPSASSSSSASSSGSSHSRRSSHKVTRKPKESSAIPMDRKAGFSSPAVVQSSSPPNRSSMGIVISEGRKRRGTDGADTPFITTTPPTPSPLEQAKRSYTAPIQQQRPPTIPEQPANTTSPPYPVSPPAEMDRRDYMAYHPASPVSQIHPALRAGSPNPSSPTSPSSPHNTAPFSPMRGSPPQHQRPFSHNSPPQNQQPFSPVRNSPPQNQQPFSPVRNSPPQNQQPFSPVRNSPSQQHRPYTPMSPPLSHRTFSPPAPRPISTNLTSPTSPTHPTRVSHPAEDPYSFLSTFDTIFIIDDSASMAGPSWSQTCAALQTFTSIAARHDTNGIDIHFLNHPTHDLYNITTPAPIPALFASITPRGVTPTGKCLDEILRDYLEEYEAYKRDPETMPPVKPLNIVVLTDGEPTDDPESVIVDAARRLDRLNAPLHQVGIQFLQVGDEPGAEEALRDLDDALVGVHGIRDMVDTTKFQGEVEGEVVLKALLGGVNRRWDRKMM